jgi:CPA1 family monovalent cation:H+ antiporter
MRGIVSLAAALALPLTTQTGMPLPFRAEIILITFMVILVTLVVQGLSLPILIRRFNIGEDRSIEHEEKHAREHAHSAALDFLDNVAREDWPIAEHIEQLRIHYKNRRQYHVNLENSDIENKLFLAEAFRRLQHETMTAERLAIIKLRNEGTISDEILHRLEQELDIEALRIGIGERRISKKTHR